MTIQRSTLREAALYGGGIAVPILSGLTMEALHHTVRSTAVMVLLLEVLAIASLGRAPLAIISSIVAALTLSYNILPPVRSFAVSAPENVTALVVFVIVAVAGSQLSLRAENRAQEANRRREEMEKLQLFSSSLLTADSLPHAADAITGEATRHFQFDGVELVLFGEPPMRADQSFSSGRLNRSKANVLPLDSEVRAELRLFGAPLSEESQRALCNVVSLILDRAKGAEDRVRFEAEQRSDELHTTVLNALAHNFRTPLTTIKIASSTLLTARHSDTRSDASGERGREHELLQAIDEEADRLQTLISESLQMARLERRRSEKPGELCSVQDIVAGASRKLGRYLPPDRLLLKFDEDLPQLRGDPLLFEQMVFQVVDNAWKYSLPTAKIWITARVDSTYLILTVKNEGAPVPQMEKERIFERFARGSQVRKKVEGTGLGLAIARTIAQSYGGRLWLDTEPEGPAFRFSIPVAEKGDKLDRKQYDPDY